MRAELIPIVIGPPAPDRPRTEGIHVSSVLRGLAIHHGFLRLDAHDLTAATISLIEVSGEDRWYTFDQTSQLRMSLGLSWEQWYARQLPGVQFHPGEWCLDGIYLTPDGESLDEQPNDDGSMWLEYAIHEIKATYKSLRKIDQITLADQWLWISQMQAYCKAARCLVAYLHVVFLCGDYTYPIRPQIRCWRIEFTQDEIDRKWDEILTFVAEHTDAPE